MPLGKLVISEQLLANENMFNFISDNFDILNSHEHECKCCTQLLCDSRYFEILEENDEIPFYNIVVKSDIHKNIWVSQCVKMFF